MLGGTFNNRECVVPKCLPTFLHGFITSKGIIFFLELRLQSWRITYSGNIVVITLSSIL